MMLIWRVKVLMVGKHILELNVLMESYFCNLWDMKYKDYTVG